MSNHLNKNVKHLLDKNECYYPELKEAFGIQVAEDLSLIAHGLLPGHIIAVNLLANKFGVTLDDIVNSDITLK